jgi:hypothetical protein
MIPIKHVNILFNYFVFYHLFLVFNRTLEKDIVGDTSGHLKKLLVALMQGQRPESNKVNQDEAENDAKTLFEAGEKKWGTDESKFIEILSNRRLIINFVPSAFLKFLYMLLVMHN